MQHRFLHLNVAVIIIYKYHTYSLITYFSWRLSLCWHANNFFAAKNDLGWSKWLSVLKHSPICQCLPIVKVLEEIFKMCNNKTMFFWKGVQNLVVIYDISVEFCLLRLPIWIIFWPLQSRNGQKMTPSYMAAAWVGRWW